jgi:hypothetical protein
MDGKVSYEEFVLLMTAKWNEIKKMSSIENTLSSNNKKENGKDEFFCCCFGFSFI